MKITALVVDDSRIMRQMVKTTLRQTALAEFEFTEAEDGEDALAKFDPKTTDIVFADWNMPNMSGVDFVRQVRRTYADCKVPIIMITSEKTVGKMEEALDQAGANGYITKPFTVDELEKKLASVFHDIARQRQKQSRGGGGFFSKLRGGG